MLKEIREKIKKDNETKDLVLDDSDLLKVNRYLELRGKEIDGYILKLDTDPYIEIRYIPTKEKQEEILQEKISKHLKSFDSDIYLQDASLEDFRVTNSERENALLKAKEFLDIYNKKTYMKGLYIYGKYATGKTYLLSAIARNLAKRGVSVLLVFMPDLVRNIKNGINEGTLEAKINTLKQADILMLDDIGGENMTSWFRDEIILPVIQYRLSAKLPMFFSSNLTMQELTNSLAIGSSEIDYVKAVRLIQRIKEMSVYVKLSELKYEK